MEVNSQNEVMDNIGQLTIWDYWRCKDCTMCIGQNMSPVVAADSVMF